MRGPTRALLAATVVLAVAAAGSAQAAVHGLLTGFTDHSTFEFATQPDRMIGLQHARAAGASIIRVELDWAYTAPSRPPSRAVERDPGWSGYNWSATDSVVRDIAASGLRPLVEVSTAPRWAEGPHRPPVSVFVPAGAWRPSAADFQAFAQAAARRYSGHYPDPARAGALLPRVRFWQAWNEPNLGNFISPQWVKTRHGQLATSPVIYRRLLNGFYKGVKAVSKGNLVITAGTSPFGDRPGGFRMPPALFDRELFCLRGRIALRRFRCAGSPVRFDALAHHPYPLGSPLQHALNPDDVSIPDLARLTRPLAVALRDGTVAPRRHKQLWLTEFSWDSRPPDPGGIPVNIEAGWVAGALSELWSEGANVAVWYGLRDEAPIPNYAETLQSGVYYRGPTVEQDTPKPAFSAFRFPFTAYRHRGVAQLWGLAPRPGRVSVQARRHGRWVTVAQLHARRDRLFLGHLRVASGTRLRAFQGSSASWSWRVR